MQRLYVWDPKYLPVYFDTSQPMLREVLFFQTEKGEVWQIAEDGLKPTMLAHDFAYPRILKFVDVKREHCDVLRSSRRGKRIQNRLRQVLAEVNTALFQFEHFRYLLRERQSF